MFDTESQLCSNEAIESRLRAYLSAKNAGSFSFSIKNRFYRVSQKNAPMFAHFPSKMANMGAFFLGHPVGSMVVRLNGR